MDDDNTAPVIICPWLKERKKTSHKSCSSVQAKKRLPQPFKRWLRMEAVDTYGTFGLWEKDWCAFLSYARQPSVRLLVPQNCSLARISTARFEKRACPPKEEEATFRTPQILTPIPLRGRLSLRSRGEEFVSLTGRSDTFKSEHGCWVSCLVQSRPPAPVQHFGPFSSSSRMDNYCSAWRLSVLPPDALKPLTSSKTNSTPTHRQCREDKQVKRMATQVEVKESIDLKRCHSKK